MPLWKRQTAKSKERKKVKKKSSGAEKHFAEQWLVAEIARKTTREKKISFDDGSQLLHWKEAIPIAGASLWHFRSVAFRCKRANNVWQQSGSLRRISFACLSPPAFPVQSSSPADKRTPKRRFGAIRHVMNVKNKTCLFCLKQRQILVDDSCTAKAIQKIYSITVRKNKSISQTSAQIRSRVDTGRILECVFYLFWKKQFGGKNGFREIVLSCGADMDMRKISRVCKDCKC